MINLLAETDTLISGNWIIAMIGAIAAGIALVVGKKQGRNEAENARDVLIKKPVPTIQTREEPHWATKPELNDHIERTDKQINAIWSAIKNERLTTTDALNRIHERVDAQVTAVAEIKGTVGEVKTILNQLVNLALHQSSGKS